MLRKVLKESMFVIGLIVVLAVWMLQLEYTYAQYPNVVEATLTSIYNPNDNREVIGYGRHGAVYNKPSVPYVILTYNYEVDNVIYEYIVKSVFTDKETIKLRYKDNPENVIVDNRN